MDETGTPRRDAPLPPVTTRWDAPAMPRSSSAAALAPPFSPGGAAPATAQPPVLRTFDSEPAEEAHVPVTAAPDEGPLPWEMSGEPEASSEPEDSESHTEPDLEDWESAVDPSAGQAVPAWGNEEEAEEAAFSPPPQLDDEGAVIAQPERADRTFPLDAFIIPPDAKRLPKGLEHAEELHLEIAEELAKRLEDVAQRLRREGFAGLLHHEAGQEPIDTLLAGVLAGYLSNKADA